MPFRPYLYLYSYPTFLYGGGILMGRLVSGDDLLAHDPADAIRTAGQRPLYVIHGTADTRINVHHSRQLAELAEATGANATVWIIDGVEHVRAAATHTAEYEERLLFFFGEALGRP